MLRVTDPTTRFSADEFQRMSDAGVFGLQRVELINGRIYRMSPQNHPHMVAVSKVTRVLTKAVPDHEWLTIQGTIHIDRNTTVDPEFIWLTRPLGTPEDQWGAPVLLVEVSDTTYRTDSGIKLRKYAKVRIPEYWIVNVKARRVEVCRHPEGMRLSECRYADVTHHMAGDTISPIARPEAKFAVADLLP